MSTENANGFDFSSSSGHDTLITGHGGGGGSQLPPSTILTVNAASTFPPLPSVTFTRTSCACCSALLKSQITDLPLPKIEPPVVEYSYCSASPSGSVALTSRFTSGLSYNSGWNVQTRSVVDDEVNESIVGGRLRWRRGFCSAVVRSGNTRANEIANRRFTNLFYSKRTNIWSLHYKTGFSAPDVT